MAMRKLIEQVKDLSLVAECENAMAAYNIVNQKPVDVLFLDIEMPGMTGIELTKNLKQKNPFIIFTTAKPDYAVDAFELNVIDYLVKPIEPARFLKAVDRLKEAFESNKEQVQVRDKEFVFIKDNGVLKRVSAGRYSISRGNGRLREKFLPPKVSHCPFHIKIDRGKITSH